MLQNIIDQVKKNEASELAFNQLSIVDYSTCNSEILFDSISGIANVIFIPNDYVIIDQSIRVCLYNTKTKSSVVRVLVLLPNDVTGLTPCNINASLVAGIDRSASYQLFFWDLTDISQPKYMPFKYRGVSAICPLDETFIAIVHNKNTISVIDYKSGTTKIELHMSTEVSFICKWGTNELVLVNANNSVLILDWRKNNERHLLLHYPYLFYCIASHDQHGLALSCGNKTVLIWNASLNGYLTIYAEIIKQLIWLPDGTLVGATLSGMVSIWRPHQKLLLSRLHLSKFMVSSIQMHGQNELIITSGPVLSGKVTIHTFKTSPFQFKDIIFALPALDENTSIASINFDNLQIDKNNLHLLLKLLQPIKSCGKVNSIRYISLCNCGLDRFAILQLIAAFNDNRYIISINLKDNLIIDNDLLPKTMLLERRSNESDNKVPAIPNESIFDKFDLWRYIDSLSMDSVNSLDFRNLYALNYGLSDMHFSGNFTSISCIIPNSPTSFISITNNGIITVHDVQIHQSSIVGCSVEFIWPGVILAKLSNNILIVGAGKSIEIWDIEQKKCTNKIMLKESVWSVAAIDEDHFVTSSAHSELRLWYRDGKELFSTTINKNNSGLVNAIFGLAIYESGDKKYVVTGDSYGAVNLFYVEHDKLVYSDTLINHNHRIYTLVVIDSRFLVCGTKDGRLIIYDLTKKTILHNINAHNNSINCIAHLKDSMIACGSSDKTISVLDVLHGEKLYTLTGHVDKVYAMASISNDCFVSGAGNICGNIWMGSKDSNIRIWKKQPHSLTNLHIKFALQRSTNIFIGSLIMDDVTIESDLLQELLAFITKTRTLYFLSLARTALNYKMVDQLLLCIEMHNFTIIDIDLTGIEITKKQSEKIIELQNRNKHYMPDETPDSVIEKALAEQIVSNLKWYSSFFSSNDTRDKLFIEEENMVTVSIWKRVWRWPPKDKEVGHISLRTYGPEGIYASYWPNDPAKVSLKHKGVQAVNVANFDLDQLFEGNFQKLIPPDVVIHFYSLNAKEINAHFRKLKSLNYNWSAWGSSIFRNEATHNCVGLVSELLTVGGIDALLNEETPIEYYAALIGEAVYASFATVLLIAGAVTNNTGIIESAYRLSQNESLMEVSANAGKGVVEAGKKIFSSIMTPNGVGELVKKAKKAEQKKYEYVRKPIEKYSSSHNRHSTSKQKAFSPRSSESIRRISILEDIYNGRVDYFEIENRNRAEGDLMDISFLRPFPDIRCKTFFENPAAESAIVQPSVLLTSSQAVVNREDPLSSIQNSTSCATSLQDPPKILSATLGDQPVQFVRELISGDGNCGLTGLGTIRTELVKTLLTLVNNQEARESLFEEISQAFFSMEITPPADEWQRLLHEKTKVQGGDDNLIRALRDQIPEAKQFEGNKRNELISWLKTNDHEGWSVKLEGQAKVIDHIENRIKEYCCSEEVYKYYVNSYLSEARRLWIGHASALLYAKAKQISLYIWEQQGNSNQLILKNKNIESEPKNVIHLFYTDGATHFDLLIEANAPKLAVSKSPATNAAQAFFKPVAALSSPSTVLTDEQIAENIATTRSEEEAARSVQNNVLGK